MSIVLASSSPRRKELLEMLGVKDLIVIPARGEEVPPQNASPEETVMALSLAKAREVAAQRGAEDTVIAADTVVWLGERIYGKPHSREHAFEMLRTLSGNWHSVYTGVTVIAKGETVSRFEMSRVHFRELSDAEIWRYIDTLEPMDKAGAYGAQGKGALFVDRIEGDFFNVMGLPVCLLGQMLSKQGVSIL